jgi:hypothetical protein
MVTPGALGALAMLATNTLVGNFPNMNAPIIALILSFLLGFAALVKSTSIFEKILYYLLNSIIIFSVAAGANKLGQQIQQTSLSLPTLSAYATPRVDIGALAQSSEQIKFFKEWFPNVPRSQLNPANPTSHTDHPDHREPGGNPMPSTDHPDHHEPGEDPMPR